RGLYRRLLRRPASGSDSRPRLRQRTAARVRTARAPGSGISPEQSAHPSFQGHEHLMAQLDQIIKIMLGQPGSELYLATGLEPQLKMEAAPPHTLIQRKLTAPHLRVLLGELATDQPGTIGVLEQADSGEFTYTAQGSPAVTVIVRGWSGNVE